jgi:hypothetical protein
MCSFHPSLYLQLIHVYAKNYEGNGQLLLIRIVRYSLDGMGLYYIINLPFTHLNQAWFFLKFVCFAHVN